MSPIPPYSSALPGLSAEHTATLAAFLMESAEEYGVVIFDTSTDAWNSVYISDRARNFLGGIGVTQDPPYLPVVVSNLRLRSHSAKEPILVALPDGCIEVRGGYVVNAVPSLSPTASRLFYVLLRTTDIREARLREERDRLERALEATGEAVWDWDLESGDAFVSPRWAEMLGRTGGSPEVEALHSPENWLDSIHPDNRDEVANAYAEFIVGERTEFDVEFRIRHSGGRYRWIRSRASALRRDDNTAWRVTGVHNDITHRKELEAAQEALLAQQSKIAETLQRVLLPLPSGINSTAVEVALHYEPASDEAMVGGDFCDAFPMGDHEIAFVVGDVMGKGLAAAVSTAEIKFSLRTLLRQYRDPAVALRLLNRLLWESYLSEHRRNPPMVPIAVAIANTRTKYLRISVAGAEPPMLLRRDPETGATSYQEIMAAGMPIGTLQDEEYERQIIPMGPEDCLLMTTDGLTEVRDSWTNSFLGTKGVARLTLHALSSRRPLEDIKGVVIRSVRNFGGGKDALRDDVSLILARWRQ